MHLRFLFRGEARWSRAYLSISTSLCRPAVSTELFRSKPNKHSLLLRHEYKKRFRMSSYPILRHLYFPMPRSVGHDCWTTLAAVAAVTRTIRLGTHVSCVAYRPPVLLARMAADIDAISNGRLVLG